MPRPIKPRDDDNLHRYLMRSRMLCRALLVIASQPGELDTREIASLCRGKMRWTRGWSSTNARMLEHSGLVHVRRTSLHREKDRGYIFIKATVRGRQHAIRIMETHSRIDKGVFDTGLLHQVGSTIFIYSDNRVSSEPNLFVAQDLIHAWEADMFHSLWSSDHLALFRKWVRIFRRVPWAKQFEEGAHTRKVRFRLGNKTLTGELNPYGTFVFPMGDGQELRIAESATVLHEDLLHKLFTGGI